MDTSQNVKQNKTLMAILAYIGPLVIVSYIVANEDPFVKFHIKQGLVLIVIELISWVLMSVFWPFWFFTRIIDLGVLVLAILGIINAYEGKEKELPLVGSFAKNFNF